VVSSPRISIGPAGCRINTVTEGLCEARLGTERTWDLRAALVRSDLDRPGYRDHINTDSTGTK